VFLAFFGPPVVSGFSRTGDSPPKGGHHEPHDPPKVMMGPLWLLALLSLGVGVYSTLTGHVLSFGPAEGEHAPGWLTPAAVGVAVAGIVLAWLTYQRRAIDANRLAAMFGPIRRAAIAKFWIDDLFEGVLGMALMTFSRIIGWLDRYLVDGVLNVLSAWTVSSGGVLRTMQTGRAQDYVYGVAVGVLILILWMRWALA
jgi:NADH-quinone oxidoreductase subunit L